MSTPDTDTPPPQQMIGEPIADEGKKDKEGCNLTTTLKARETFRIEYEGVVNEDRDKLALNAVRKKMARVRERFAALAADYCREGDGKCQGNRKCLPKLGDLSLGYTRENPTEKGFDLVIEISARVECYCEAAG